MDAQNVLKFAVADSSVVATQSASHVITRLNAIVEVDSLLMEKLARKLNVKVIRSAAMISDVTTTCANSSVLWTNLAVKMHFAQLKIINECVNVNQAILAIRMSVAKLLTSVKVHLVRPVQLVATIVDHSSVSANKDSLVIPTIMDAKNLKNVKSTMTVPRQQNVSLKMDQTSVKMFVRMSNVA